MLLKVRHFLNYTTLLLLHCAVVLLQILSLHCIVALSLYYITCLGQWIINTKGSEKPLINFTHIICSSTANYFTSFTQRHDHQQQFLHHTHWYIHKLPAVVLSLELLCLFQECSSMNTNTVRALWLNDNNNTMLTIHPWLLC